MSFCRHLANRKRSLQGTSINRFPAIYRIAKQKAWFLLCSIGLSLKVIDQCPHVPVRAGTPNQSKCPTELEQGYAR